MQALPEWRNCAPSSPREKKAQTFPISSASRNRRTGAACGITRGAQAPTRTASRCTAACIATCGPTGQSECLEFADYTFEEHFGKPIASYPPREVLWDYIRGRVEKAGVRPYIRFNTAVRQVCFDAASRGNSPSLLKTIPPAPRRRKRFDYVVNACGHFSTPNAPSFPGFESFGGRILHAHDFRDALEFKDKDVLLVGSFSYSAEDIALWQCWRSTVRRALRVAIAPRRWAITGPKTGKRNRYCSACAAISLTSPDDTHKRIDAIILCTGYQHHFPFLPDELHLKTGNRLWPLNLYKGIFWEDNPGLIYLGMQDLWYSFNMFDAQAWYAREVILGRITLPPKAEMTAHSLAWRAKEESLVTHQEMFEFQGS